MHIHLLLMVQNPQVTRDDLVLQDGPGWNVDSVPVVGNDDHCPTQAHWIIYYSQ